MITTENIRANLLLSCEKDDLESFENTFNTYLLAEQEIELCQISNNFCAMCFQQSFIASAINDSPKVFDYLCSQINKNNNFLIPQSRFFHILKQDVHNSIIETTLKTILSLDYVSKKDLNDLISLQKLPKQDLVVTLLENYQIRNSLKEEFQSVKNSKAMKI